MGTLFPGQSKIGAGLPPFFAVGIDPPPAGALLRQQMREFVPKRSVDLLQPKLRQPRIERDQSATGERHPRGVPQTRIPTNDESRRECRAAEPFQEFSRLRVELFSGRQSNRDWLFICERRTRLDLWRGRGWCGLDWSGLCLPKGEERLEKIELHQSLF